MPDSCKVRTLERCPHCGASNTTIHLIAHTRRDASSLLVAHDRSDYSIDSFWECANCRRGICIESGGFCEDAPPYVNDIKAIFPSPPEICAPEHTPEPIAADYIEALSCFQSCNFRSSAMMSRSVLERTVQKFSASGRSLKEKIEYLAQEHTITQSLADWAQTLRVIGNEAAHEMDPVDEKEAQQALYFSEMLLRYLFTLPHMVEQRKAESSN